MADIYTSARDEETLRMVMEKGLGVPMNDPARGARGLPKWLGLRLALSYSLHIPTPPDEDLDRVEERGSEYHLEQVTGKGQMQPEGAPRQDFDDAFCVLLSVCHERDLFADFGTYRRLLQRHIRRGLRELRNGWRESHDFHEMLYQELLADRNAGPVEQPRLRLELEQGLQEIGVAGEIREALNGPRITRFLVYLADVNDLDRLKKGLEKLAFFLGLQEQGIFPAATAEPKVIGLDVPRRRDTWQVVGGEHLREWAQAPAEGADLPVWPGVDVLGKPYQFDLAKAPHLLIGGATGSGKSVCLHAMLVSLLLRNNAERLGLCLIDPKRVELDPYKRLPRLIGGDVVQDQETALEVLNGLVDMMESRTQRLVQLGVRDIGEAHAKGEREMPFVVVVVEELADLLMQSRDIEVPLVRLAQKARATGIHLILATQRPDAATFSGLLRSNIPTRIALTVQKSSESKIILDETGAERLTGMGDMLVKTAQGQLVRVHGARVTQDDIAAAVKIFSGER
jgi:DNA segregation ATPase FtsK/SpoIIIE, S-DNA-T family